MHPKINSLFITAIFLGCAIGSQAAGNLESDFANPPWEARPGSWLFWMAGNVSEPGLVDCFDAMEATGLSSVVTMLISNYGGRVPDGPVTVLSPEWRQLVDYQMQLARERNIAATLFTTETGWSMMGDTEVEPADSSKRLSSTETVVSGGQAAPIRLPQPEARLRVYQDLAVVAFPEPSGANHPVPTIEAAPEGIAWEKLTDNNWLTGVELPSRDVAIVLEYPRPLRVNSFRFWMPNWRTRPHLIVVEAQNGADTWREIGRMDPYWPHGYADVPLIIRLEPAEAKRFRVRFNGGANALVNGIELNGANLVDLFDAKAGYTQRREHGGGADLIRASAEKWAAHENLPGIDPASIIDLTGKLAPDGTLDWTPPPGCWRVIRIGWTTAGHRAGPSPRNVISYIIDPVEKDAVADYWTRFPASMLGKHGPKTGGPIKAVEMDSWEAGNLNWSTDFPQEFRKRNGYSMSAYWPLLASGYAVGDSLTSERFLRDFRATLAELISERYYAETARMAHRDGVEFFAEASGRQQFNYHPAEYLRHADVPMGEFWVNEGTPRPDCRASSSSAHFYGRTRAGAEAFTAVDHMANFDWMPAKLKKLGDEAFIEGINYFKLVVNAVNPYRGPDPGVVAATIGSQMVTGNTWWGKPARGWTDYLARCQFLLQQGRNVADILYFAGEDFPTELPARADMRPAIPPGIEYDCCGPEELLQHLTVEDDGTLVSTGGARYRVLMLRDWATMTAPVADKIRELVEAGAVVLGPPPQRAAGLTQLQATEQTLAKLADDLWGTRDRSAAVDRRFGKGRVFWNKSISEIFATLNLSADFAAPADRDIRFRHRSGDGFDLYFVSNQEQQPFTGELAFRVTGKVPELWDPLSGTTRKLAHWTQADGMTRLPVDLGPYGSTFVVFRESGQPAAIAAAAPQPSAFPFPGSWRVTFQKDRGAPDSVELPSLINLTTHADKGVRHFSGTATYHADFVLAPSQISNLESQTFLDLGTVHGIAEVTLNGQPVANLWCPPYRTELPPGLLREGSNRLEIAVTNSWRNRMIADEEHPRDFKTVTMLGRDFVNEWPDWYVQGQPRPVKERVSFCTTLYYNKTDALEPSGMVGPVRLVAEKQLMLQP